MNIFIGSLLTTHFLYCMMYFLVTLFKLILIIFYYTAGQKPNFGDYHLTILENYFKWLFKHTFFDISVFQES